MTFGQIRLVKRVLLLLLIVSAVYVSHRVWTGVRARKTDSTPSVAGPGAAVSREVEIEQLDSEGRTAWRLRAAESTGQTEDSQRFRDVEIRFDAGEEKVPVVVTADRCEVRKDSAVFLEGNVVVRDESSLRLEAKTLHFERYPDRVWSTEPVRYFREGLSGDAGEMRYRLEDGFLELGAGVAMTIQEKGKAPLRVTSRSSTMRRRLHVVQYVDEVRVRQTSQALDCNDLQVYLTESNDAIERIEAYENVDLRLDVAEEEDAAEASPSEKGERGAVDSRRALTSEPGTKRLLTDRLEMFFRPGGEYLERARAMEGGRLVITLPQDSRTGYHKELESYTLAFDFDEEGRLQTLRGRGGVTLVLTPASADAEPNKTVTARALEAEFDPVTGELVKAVCDRAVTFEQGDVRATSELGTFHSRESLLVLEQEPRLWDSKATLEAREIRIHVESGDLEGEGNVRSTSDRSGEAGGLFPASGNDPVYFVSRRLRFDRAKDLAVYTGDARAIRGPNRIEADRIELQQGKGEMAAEGRLRTVFLQKVREESQRPEPTVTEAERLFYRSSEEKLQYRGAVAMRSKDLTLRGDAVDVSCRPGGNEVEEIFAEREVSIETADGKAGGDTAKYLPSDDSMTVTGDRAWLENAGKLTEGKQLTFFLGNDKIFVDGREQTRTKTTYSSKPRQ